MWFRWGEVYEDYGLWGLGFGEKRKFERKGECKWVGMGGGRIICGYGFVKQMEEMCKKVDMEIGKGGSKKVDLIGGKVIEKYDIEEVDSIWKKDFKKRDKGIDVMNEK